MPARAFMAEHHAYLALMVSLDEPATTSSTTTACTTCRWRWPPALRTPMLTTLHSPPTPWLESAIAVARPRRRRLALGLGLPRQRRRLGARSARPCRVIPNGISWTSGATRRGRGAAARSGAAGSCRRRDRTWRSRRRARAGVPLTIAGPVDDREYFERCLDGAGPEVHYAGHLESERAGGAGRRRRGGPGDPLLGGAVRPGRDRGARLRHAGRRPSPAAPCRRSSTPAPAPSPRPTTPPTWRGRSAPRGASAGRLPPPRRAPLLARGDDRPLPRRLPPLSARTSGVSAAAADRDLRPPPRRRPRRPGRGDRAGAARARRRGHLPQLAARGAASARARSSRCRSTPTAARVPARPRPSSTSRRSARPGWRAGWRRSPPGSPRAGRTCPGRRLGRGRAAGPPLRRPASPTCARAASRDDPPHRLAYGWAAGLLAPYPEWLEPARDAAGDPRAERPRRRGHPLRRRRPPAPGEPAAAGAGPRRRRPADRRRSPPALPAGRCWSPPWSTRRVDLELLASCAVVVAPGGANAVAEAAFARCGLVCLPQPRPFGEQEARGEDLERDRRRRRAPRGAAGALRVAALLEEARARRAGARAAGPTAAAPAGPPTT